MTERTRIEWADATVNFWHGCTPVSPGCRHCYAAELDRRFHAEAPHWGLTASRWVRLPAAAAEAVRLDRRAERSGQRLRVFANSMGDFWEDRPELEAPRLMAFEVIRQTPHLDWLLLTKRPERVPALLGRASEEAWGQALLDPAREDLADWLGDWTLGYAPGHVWLGASVEDQATADRRLPDLLGLPAAVRFVSCEPLLGPVDLRLGDCWLGFTPNGDRLHWVIAGGESGPGARPVHPAWVRSLRDQCQAAGLPFLFKSWGRSDGHGALRPRSGSAGRLLDGELHDNYPEVRP
jgi:protein gp37